jgi:hypothetical protein
MAAPSPTLLDPISISVFPANCGELSSKGAFELPFSFSHNLTTTLESGLLFFLLESARKSLLESRQMPPLLKTIGLLLCSNVFMTFAWYAHLKELNHKPWIVAALLSWGIALFEYLFQVPANRIGYSVASVGQLKILQEVITLSVFVPFSVYYLKEPLKLDYLWAGLCLVGAVYFIFRSR